jgi:hypothetical protein
MQTKLWQLVRQTKQPLASILLATFCTGLSHPYHTNSIKIDTVDGEAQDSKRQEAD